MVVALLYFSCCLLAAEAEQGVTATNTINFSGHVWKVKASVKRVGPGANYFSDSPDNVWVDEAGRLHLRLTQSEGKWHCAEVISKESFGFGTYRFRVTTPMSELDPNLTLGLFTWSDAPEYAHREIDVECGKWGKAADTNNAQFVVQPYQIRGRLLRYQASENSDVLAHGFLWQSNSVLFQCVAEDPTTFSNAVVQEWRFAGNRIPQPRDENVRMNLWLPTGHGPLNTNHVEIVVSKFEFIPPDADFVKKKQGQSENQHGNTNVVAHP